MATVAALQNRSDDSVEHPPRRPRRRIVVLVVVGVGVLVLMGAVSVLVRHLHAAAARDGVVVLTDQDALTCTPRSAVTRAPVAAGIDGEESLVVPAVRLEQPTTCQLRFVIVNQGSQTVQIDAVHLAGLYPLSGLKVANSNDGPLNGGVYPLDPGEAVASHVTLSWRAGCIANGNTDSDPDSPSVTVTADGLPGTVSLHGTAYAVLGTAHSENKCPWRR